MKSFEDLEVYKKSFNFTIAIFQPTEKTVINKNVVHQLERATLSISNNTHVEFRNSAFEISKQFSNFIKYLNKSEIY